MTDETDADAVNEAIERELRLLSPAVRSSRTETARLLDPEFTEVGASGRRYTYAEMLAELSGHPGGGADGPVYEPSGITGVLLAPGLVHLTYETVLDGRRARRCSLWRRRDEESGWRMYYHQGTPVPPGTA
ncbi:nuclear transport factor 2 family protein [Streptomyces fungicidicus]|uniref:nuclear transport factor 2 family protein n=1 Tax=Streptomyces fungicidicus TaxID=68203 RepID=UPI00369ABF4C